MSIDVVVQEGHVPRLKGATGTAGHRGTEQAFALEIGPRIAERLRAAGLSVALIGADDPRPTAEVFLALHQDGSDDPGARGASVGYPRYGDGATLARIFKARYTLAGWPDGFNPDNYTTGLRWYYGFGWNRYSKRLARFGAALLIEHGFATTVSEDNWMWDHLDVIAKVDADTILQYLGKLEPTPTDAAGVLAHLGRSAGLPSSTGDDVDLINDTEAERMWATWVNGGTTVVREYSDYRGADVGKPMPGIATVIDEQIGAGRLRKA